MWRESTIFLFTLIEMWVGSLVDVLCTIEREGTLGGYSLPVYYPSVLRVHDVKYLSNGRVVSDVLRLHDEEFLILVVAIAEGLAHAIVILCNPLRSMPLKRLCPTR